jgi:superfamily I DNA/RNA helicase
MSDRYKAEHKWTLYRAVQQAKSYALDSILTHDEYADMVDTYDLDTYDGMEEHVNRVLDISDNNLDTVDFDDQIRIPALYRCTFAPYANVLCDEVQDFSPIQALLISRLQAERYVFVGDTHQSIYGFRGAMAGSMDYLSAQFSCVELPLSITYRCARSLVKEAASIYPGIEAYHSAPEGTVKYDDTADPTVLLKTGKDAMVVCRMNRPLVQLAYTLLAHDIPCHVRGRDIGQNLIRLITRQEATSIAELRTKLDAWYFDEVALAQAKHNDRKIIMLEDKYTSLTLFMDRCLPGDSPAAVIDKITALFEQGKGLCLSTIHKAKGLEAEQCCILEHGLYPYMVQRSSQPWQEEQEHNCQYVAVTRGKTSLVYM